MKKVHLFILLILTIFTFISMGLKKAGDSNIPISEVFSKTTIEQVIVEPHTTVTMTSPTHEETDPFVETAAAEGSQQTSAKETHDFSEFIGIFIALAFAVTVSLFLPLRMPHFSCHNKKPHLD